MFESFTEIFFLQVRAALWCPSALFCWTWLQQQHDDATVHHIKISMQSMTLEMFRQLFFSYQTWMLFAQGHFGKGACSGLYNQLVRCIVQKKKKALTGTGRGHSLSRHGGPSVYPVTAQCFMGNVVIASWPAYTGLNKLEWLSEATNLKIKMRHMRGSWCKNLHVGWQASRLGRKKGRLTLKIYKRGENMQNPWKITLLSSRFCSASFPVLSRISTFLGWEMSVCRSMTRPLLLPLHAERASKSSVLLSEEPSTGQKTPQNFCLGLAGLSEPMLLKKAGTSSAVDMPCGREVLSPGV